MNIDLIKQINLKYNLMFNIEKIYYAYDIIDNNSFFNSWIRIINIKMKELL